MKILHLFNILTVSALLPSTFAQDTAEPDRVGADCTINRFEEVDEIVKRCKNIIVGGFAVPGGKTLLLALQEGAHLTFTGGIAFAYAEWDGPLVRITGKRITVVGKPGHVIDGRGGHWWDGHGDHSLKKKPRLLLIQSTGGSIFSHIKLKNCPHTCVGISDSDHILLEHWNIDCEDGDKLGGANTDGFDLAKSSNVLIRDSIIWNQDDCVCVNQGRNLEFNNLNCIGGHGLSIAAGLWADHSLNVVHNVTFQDCAVQNSRNGIHIKTIPGKQTGEISDISYNNIRLSGVTHYGIHVQEDYTNEGPTGHPVGNIPVNNFKIFGVHGTMSGPNSAAVTVLCGHGGCNNWHWSGVKITEAHKSDSCNFKPQGFSC